MKRFSENVFAILRQKFFNVKHDFSALGVKPAHRPACAG